MSTPEDILLYLLVSPQRRSEATRYHLTPAHLAYRVGSGPHLFRTQLPTPLNGGVMVLDREGFDGTGKAEPFTQEVVQECAARGFQGVFCDFEGAPTSTLERIVAILSSSLSKRGWNFYVPQGYADHAPDARVVIPTALSGGSLRHYLQEAIDRYGAQRVVLGLQWSREDFILPARNGSGTSLSVAELEMVRQKRRPNVYFSEDLCAHYFTYMPTGESPHFVLFDDAVSMSRKLELARELGLREAFLPYPDPPEELSKLLEEKQKETP